jgi:hypothetical protein
LAIREAQPVVDVEGEGSDEVEVAIDEDSTQA